MALILRTLFMQDLRGRFVFPRLVYAMSSQAVDRITRRLIRFMIMRPHNRVIQFSRTLRDHRDTAEILLAALAVLTAFVRSVASFLVAVSFLYLAILRF
jgi:hypothetical protein